MITHKEFLRTWNWKYYNYDAVYGSECVDLFKGYSRDVSWKIITVSLWAAKNYYNDSDKWWGIKTNTPLQWDFAFTDYTQWWHVGIFDHFELWGKYFWQFDQIGNWPVVWGEKPCKLRRYPISKLLWYVTYKTMEEPLMPLNELRAIWNDSKTRKFNDYTIDERTKLLIDISYNR